MTFKTLDIVALSHSIEENNLREGETGTIVEVYGNGEAYEVEFVHENGKTKVLLTLNPLDIASPQYKASVINWGTFILEKSETDITSNREESKTKVFNQCFA